MYNRLVGTLVCIALTCFSARVDAQAYVFDVDGDGLEDRVLPTGNTGDWAVMSGAAPGTILSLIPAQAPFSLFGLGSMGTPDLSGDGQVDVVMLAPAFLSGNEPVGAVHLFSGTTGDLLWTSPGLLGAYGALGAAVIPDQDEDGTLDLAVRIMDRACLDRELTLIVAGASGKHLRLIDGAMPKLARDAREQQKRLYVPTDLDNSAVVDIDDALLFFDLAANNEPRADVDGDTAITGEDLDRVLNDATAEVAVVPDEAFFCGDACSVWSMAEAEQMYSPDMVGQYVIADVIGSMQVATPDVVCDSCVVLSEAVYSIEQAAALNFAVMAFPGCTDSRPRPGYTVPAPNGCGSDWRSRGIAACSPYRWTTFGPCCSTHDNCYGTCNTSKMVCDMSFFICMGVGCEDLWGAYNRWVCRQHAKAFYLAVHYGGSGAFDDAQRAACICCDGPTPDPLCTANP